MMQYIGKFILRIFGWKLTGALPVQPKKYILIAAPHTSNMDFFMALPIMWAMGLKSKQYLIKKEVFIGPIGWILKKTGGIPVDRKNNTSEFVESLKRLFNAKKDFTLVFAPEGTRSYTKKWKTGFYRIAKSCDLPIVCAKIDYKEKYIQFSAPLYPSKDMNKDFEIMEKYYEGAHAKHPKLWNPKIFEEFES